MSRRAWMISVSAAIAATVVLFLCLSYGEFWKIDSCLDSGGAWDYSAKLCRH